MDDSLVCLRCAMSILSETHRGTMAGGRGETKEKLERNEECRSASLWCHIEILFGVWRGLPRLHLLFPILLLGGAGRITGNTTGWLCDTLR